MEVGLAISAAWTYIGGMTIGSVAIGGIIQGAIVGAAIGGLTSAVTGGDIGKGMLFGAIGGAVIGGFTGPFGQGATGMAEAGRGSAGFMTQHVGKEAIQMTAQQQLTGALGGAAASGVKGGLGSTLVEGLFQVGGGMLTGADESAEREKDFQRQLVLTKMNQAHDKEMAKLTAGGASAGALAQVAESRRQFDITQAETMRQQYNREHAMDNLVAQDARTQYKPGNVPDLDKPVNTELPPGVGYQEPIEGGMNA